MFAPPLFMTDTLNTLHRQPS